MSAQTRRPAYQAKHPGSERRCQVCGCDLKRTIFRLYCFDCQLEGQRRRWRRWYQTEVGQAWARRNRERKLERKPSRSASGGAREEAQP